MWWRLRCGRFEMERVRLSAESQKILHRGHRGNAEKNLRKIEAFTAETLRTQRKAEDTEKAAEILRLA